MKSTILHLSEGLGLDESRTGLVCPSCNGGLHKDKSLVVTRKVDGVVYYCYRATCGNTGMIHSIDRQLLRGAPKTKQKVFIPKHYDRQTVKLTATQQVWFYERNNIKPSVLLNTGIRYSPSTNTFVFPIKDYRGYTIGIEDRDYSGSRSLKSIHYWTHDTEKVHHCRLMIKPQDKIVVVEDMLSGIKCNQFVPTIVALGTALNQKIEYIRRFTRNITLYLDRDALNKAVWYKKRYDMFFDSFNVVYTKEDPKDTSNKELKELLT